MKKWRAYGWGFWGVWSVVTLIGIVIAFKLLGISIPRAFRHEESVCTWCGKQQSSYQRWLFSFKINEEIKEHDTAISRGLLSTSNTLCKHDFEMVRSNVNQNKWTGGSKGQYLLGGRLITNSHLLANELQRVNQTNAPLAREIWHDIFLASSNDRNQESPELQWLYSDHEAPQPFSVWYETNKPALRTGSKTNEKKSGPTIGK